MIKDAIANLRREFQAASLAARDSKSIINREFLRTHKKLLSSPQFVLRRLAAEHPSADRASQSVRAVLGIVEANVLYHSVPGLARGQVNRAK
jgi:hypothetical protein